MRETIDVGALIRERDALREALDEDARHIHIQDHHTTRQRIKFEDCPSAFCTLRRELLADRALASQGEQTGEGEDCGWGADHDAHPHPGLENVRCPGRSTPTPAGEATA